MNKMNKKLLLMLATLSVGIQILSASEDVIKVTKTTQILEYKEIQEMVRKCHIEQVPQYIETPIYEYKTVVVDSGPNVGGGLVGAALGGVIGHQFGGGSGKKWATGVGAVLGGSAGMNAGRTQKTQTYRRQVGTEQQISGYVEENVCSEEPIIQKKQVKRYLHEGYKGKGKKKEKVIFINENPKTKYFTVGDTNEEVRNILDDTEYSPY